MRFSFLALFAFVFAQIITASVSESIPPPPFLDLLGKVDDVTLAQKLSVNTPLASLAEEINRKTLSLSKKASTNVVALIRSFGYPVEEHKVTTDDGYQLTVHRIPSQNSTKRVVFLQHGLLDSSATWVLSDRGSLAFVLSDAGFDVWMGNSRGNQYSVGHTTLKPEDASFWEFSWDQMSEYDLPASLNRALVVTGVASLTYIGHSQGCTVGFGLLGSKPEWQKKINMFFSLAPAPFLGHMKLPFIKQLTILPPITIRLLFGKRYFMRSSSDIPFHVICNISPFICHNVFCLLCGCNSSTSMPSHRMSEVLQYFPAGTSVQNMLHYTQSVKSQQFQKYDWGKKENIRRYDSPTPPVYNTHNITTPTIFFYGSEDQLADDVDVEYLMEQLLPPAVQKFKISYGHGDFVWAPSATKAVYQPLVSLIFKYVVNK